MNICVVAVRDPQSLAGVAHSQPLLGCTQQTTGMTWTLAGKPIMATTMWDQVVAIFWVQIRERCAIEMNRGVGSTGPGVLLISDRPFPYMHITLAVTSAQPPS